MRASITMKVIAICIIVGVLTGCSSYKGAQAKPDKYYKDGKPVPGDFKVQHTFEF